MAEVSLNIADNHGTFSVFVGDLVRIALSQNAASTGFEWGVVRFSEDQLTFKGSTTELDMGGDSGIGAGHQDAVFRFQAVAEGHGFIELGLSRGDPRHSANITFRVSVRVTAAP